MSSDSSPKTEKSNVTWRKDVIEIVLFIGIAVLVVLTFNNVLGLILHTNSPLVVVTSESMEPIYWGSNRDDHGGDFDIRKDMLIVKGVDPSEIKVGDTIVYKYINHTEGVDIPIVHRVNRIYQDNITGDYWFTTKGDNPNTNANYIEDPRINELAIHESRVVGKIIGRIPYLGGIYYYFQSKQGRTVLLVGVGVIFLITILFSMFGKDEEKEKESSEVFSEKGETKSNKKENTQSEENTTLTKIKKFYYKVKKQKHFVIPGIILLAIILVPTIDTFVADWNTHFGLVAVSYDRTRQYNVEGGNDWFVYTFITMNCPGHWHQKFNGLTVEVLNKTTSEVLGENHWSIVYNFEGEKRISSGAWVENGLLIDGQDYQIRVTAHLSSKFGRSWTDVITIDFTFNSMI